MGFGVVVGLIARSLLPGEEPKGALGTLVLGLGGSSVGLLLVVALWEHFNPIGQLGFFVSVLAAMGLLLAYRLSLTLWKKRGKAKTK